MRLHATIRGADRDYAVNLIRAICALAGPLSIIEDARESLRDPGVLAAMNSRDTGKLFDWLVSVLSFQGIADAVAQKYIDEHGQVTWPAINRDLMVRPACAKLRS